jgi:hypothetical protein
MEWNGAQGRSGRLIGEIAEGDSLKVTPACDTAITVQNEIEERISHFQRGNVTQSRSKIQSWIRNASLYRENRRVNWDEAEDQQNYQAMIPPPGEERKVSCHQRVAIMV